MAKNKKGFMLYADQKEVFEQLTNEQAGDLIKHIFKFVNDENPKASNIITNIAFTPIKQQLKRDLLKWEGVKEKRSVAGKISAEKRKQQKATQSTHVESVQQKATQSTVIDTVNVNENVTVNDTVTVKVKDINYNEIKEIFNSHCLGLPKIKTLTDSRKKLLKNRIAETSLESIGELFKKVNESDFLNGKNSKGWTANFDWILNPNNFIKILEDNYKNKKNETDRAANKGATNEEIGIILNKHFQHLPD